MLSYDLHIHSCLSPCGDDDMTPGNILGMASLIGLDLIALTDHNSCKNCPSLLAQAENFPLRVIPGMELTTCEEVHVLCYFTSLADAMAFDAYVTAHLLPVANDPAIFGNQLLCDARDAVCGKLDSLLISATDISFFELEALLKKYQGMMAPAHMDKHSNSLISQLGFVPEGIAFPYFEVQTLTSLTELRERFPVLRDIPVLCSSDAHRLEGLHEKLYELEEPFFRCPSSERPPAPAAMPQSTLAPARYRK